MKIAGVGHYLPSRIVTNEWLENECNLKKGWIKRRTGVEERRWVEGESNSEMGAKAAEEALRMAQILPDQLDLIINASGTPEQAIPDGGALLQRALGLGKSGIPAWTIHATCLSFLVALDTASHFLWSGRYRNILIVSSEVASVGLNRKDPETYSLFGDGAAAVVICPSETKDSFLEQALFATYGEGAELTEIRGCGTKNHPSKPHVPLEDHFFSMKGRSTLRWIRKYKSSFLEELLPGLSQGLGDIKHVVPHQASGVGLRVMESLGWPSEKITRTLPYWGNCVSASLPLTLYQALREKQIQRGDKILLIGTGAGLSLGGIILKY